MSGLGVVGDVQRPRCRANMAHVRQSRPDYGLVFQVKVPTTFEVVPSSLGSCRQLRVLDAALRVESVVQGLGFRG